MHRKVKIAVVCNYQILDNRIGSMDRFFIAFNTRCIQKKISVDWFFPKSKKIKIYSHFNFFSDESSTVESLFIDHLISSNQKYDYVFTHFVELFTPFYKKVKILSTNSYVFAVDHMSRPLEGFSFKKKLKRKVKYLLYSKYIDKVVAVSNYIKEENLRDYSVNLKSKINTVYNGIDANLYTNSSAQSVVGESDKIKLIVVSHLVYEKGIQDLILAVYQLNKQVRERIEIDIYGKGQYKDTLKGMITRFSLEQNFSFKGSVSNLYDIYNKYHFMIQPTYMEAFSLSILESLFCGVPVITTNVGGNKEIIKSEVNGFLFEVKNIRELKSILERICIGQLTLSVDEFDKIRNEFSLTNMVDNYINLIECT